MPDMTSGRQIAASKLRRQSRQRQTYCRETGPPEGAIGFTRAGAYASDRPEPSDFDSGPGVRAGKQHGIDVLRKMPMRIEGDLNPAVDVG